MEGELHYLPLVNRGRRFKLDGRSLTDEALERDRGLLGHMCFGSVVELAMPMFGT